MPPFRAVKCTISETTKISPIFLSAGGLKEFSVSPFWGCPVAFPPALTFVWTWTWLKHFRLMVTTCEAAMPKHDASSTKGAFRQLIPVIFGADFAPASVTEQRQGGIRGAAVHFFCITLITAANNPAKFGGVLTTPDPNTSAKVSQYKWEAYRDTNWWCIYYFLPTGGHSFAKVCDRNGRYRDTFQNYRGQGSIWLS